MKRPSLLLPPCVLLLAATGPVLGAVQDDPIEWKDRRSKCPVEAWNAMEGQPAPSLADLKQWWNTDPLDWEDLRGNVVLVDVWGTWCPPCVKAVPHLVELHEKYSAQGLVVLGVHSQKSHASLAKFVESRALPYAVAADESGRFQAAMNVAFFPTYYLVGRDGKVRVAGVNKDNDATGKPWMDVALEALLAEPWDGERKTVAYKRRNEADEQPDEAGPIVPLGPDGWPAHVEKKLYAARDYRGKKAPELAVETWLTDEPALKDKVVLVDFWATWCGPCKRAMPEMQALHEKFGDDLAVIGLSDQHPDAKNPRTGAPWGPIVEEYLKVSPYTYYQALDGQARMKNAIGVEGIPHVVILDSQGIVRWQGFPGAEEDPLREAVVAKIIELDRKRRADEAQRGGGD